MKDDDPARLLRALVNQFQAGTGTLHFIDRRDGLLHLHAAVGSIPRQVREVIRAIPIGKGIAGQAAQRREPVSVCNIKTDTTGVVRSGAKSMGIEGALCVPMIADGVVVGVLGIGFHSGRTFSKLERRSLLQAAQALARGAMAKGTTTTR